MNRYKISRILTANDVRSINKLPDGSIIEFKNTKGQNKDLFRQIKQTIKVRIVGGLDEIEKPKFQDRQYFDRTIYSPLEIYKIIEKMEIIESHIEPSWNDLDKAMFIYKTLCEGMKYDHIDTPKNGRDLNRNLIGLLTGRAVCAGFAMIYKEMLDRQGIRCLYQNKQHGHAWNLIQINGKLVPVDLTWDNTENENENNRCDFKFFGRNKDFFENKNHIVTGEKVYQTSLLTNDEFNESYNKVVSRQNIQNKTKSFNTQYGAQINYIIIKDGKYKRCFISNKGLLKTVIFDDTVDLNTILNYNYYMFTGDTFIFSYDKPAIPEMKARNESIKVYKRRDGSRFFLQAEKQKKDGVIRHRLVSIENQMMNGYTLYSEDDLVHVPDELKQGVADVLLNKQRLADKVSKFKGYVGYIGIENGRLVKYANIHNEERISGIKRY